jgi:hypothetical protein
MNHLRQTKTSAGENSALTIAQGVLMMTAFMLLAATLQAAQPAWWTASGGPLNGNPPNDYALGNQGQLKLFTQKAVQYMDTNLPGGAGTNLDNLVAGWSNYYATNGYSSTNPAPQDFKAANQGQLKYIANQIYTVLAGDGYMSTNYPSWTHTNSSDYKAANIGEYKRIFAFAVAAPQAATNLVVIQAGTNATLYWSDPVVSVQSYTVQYSVNNGTNWTTYATVSGGTTNATFIGQSLGTNYAYQVTASNTAGASPPSAPTAAPIITLTAPLGATLVP